MLVLLIDNRGSILGFGIFFFVVLHDVLLLFFLDLSISNLLTTRSLLILRLVLLGLFLSGNCVQLAEVSQLLKMRIVINQFLEAVLGLNDRLSPLLPPFSLAFSLLLLPHQEPHISPLTCLLSARSPWPRTTEPIPDVVALSSSADLVLGAIFIRLALLLRAVQHNLRSASGALHVLLDPAAQARQMEDVATAQPLGKVHFLQADDAGGVDARTVGRDIQVDVR